MLKECEFCHSLFDPKGKVSKRCNKCKDLHVCEYCGVTFSSTTKYKRTCSKECASKLHDRTMIERYGVDNIFKSKEVQKRIQENNLKKYGSISPFGCKEVQNKVKETNLKKYGTENPMQNKEIQSKRRETNLKRYGVEMPFLSKEIQDKVKETHELKYGGNPFSNKDIIKKIKKTNLKKYGYECPIQSKVIQNKSMETQRKNHGGKLAFHTTKQEETMLKRYGYKYPFQSPEIQRKINHTASISKTNLKFADFLKEHGYRCKMEFVVEMYFYDIHLLNTNILIEIDPTYTHNSTYGFTRGSGGGNPKDKYYHYNKTRCALNNGFVCIHKFDWVSGSDILDIIKRLNDIDFKQYEPQCHWYNDTTGEHYLEKPDNENGFVRIYDDGIRI